MNDPSKQNLEKPVCSREELERRLKTYVHQVESMKHSKDKTKLVKLTGHIEELCVIGKFDFRAAHIQRALNEVMTDRPRAPEVSVEGLPSLEHPSGVTPAPAAPVGGRAERLRAKADAEGGAEGATTPPAADVVVEEVSEVDPTDAPPVIA